MAMGKPWHPQCFVCCQCAKQLTPPHFVEKNGKPYCEHDYHKLFSPKCGGCNTPITDVSVKSLVKPNTIYS
jgi:paxillin